MNNFKVKLPLRIDWSDMDLFGHVNNIAYFKYIQAARVNYWELCGFSPMFNAADIGPILLSTGCQFIKPLFYPGNIVVATRIEFIKNTSYGLHHQILNQQNQIIAEAHDIIVNFNFKLNIKTPISDELKTVIEKIESGNDISE